MPLQLEECSPQLELLEQLHEALCSYSDAVQALDRFHEVYGLPPLPPDEEAAEAARAMAHEFESTRSHVLAVDDVQQAGFVILARDSLSEVRAERRAAPSRRTATAPRAQCPPSASAPHPHPRAQGNCLHRSPEATPLRVIRTRSPILANSPRVEHAFLPSPSSEVLVFSPILAHRAEA